MLRSSLWRLTLLYSLLAIIPMALLLAYVHNEFKSFTADLSAETVDAEILGLRQIYDDSGINGLIQAIRARGLTGFTDQKAIYRLETRSGRFLAGNIDNWPQGVPSSEGYSFRAYLRGDDGSVEEIRAIASVFLIDQARYRLLVGRSVEERLKIQEHHARLIGFAGFLIAFMIVAGSFALARWTRNRLEEINKVARKVGKGDMQARLQTDWGRDEFGELSSHFNAMLEKVETLMRGMREVSENIAHDLRTPLARIRTRLEALLLEPNAQVKWNPDQASGLQSALDDTDNLIRTFNEMLKIAQASAGRDNISSSSFSLSKAAFNIIELYTPLAEEKNQQLSADIEDAVIMEGNEQLVTQSLLNLIDNAIKFSPEGGSVTLELAKKDRHGVKGAVIKVCDEGPGIPKEQEQRVLERFVRLDEARSTSGNGLGLSLVDAVLKMHEGQMQFSDLNPGLGVDLWLPLDAGGEGKT